MEPAALALVPGDKEGGVRGGRASERRSSTIDEAITEVGIGKTQWILLVLCGLTFCSDAAEVTFLSYVTEVLKCEWGLSKDQESLIISSVFIGMMFGAPFWGIIADKLGRRRSFLISSLVITTFGFVTALAQNFTQLIILRAVVGFGVAGLPVGFDILAEALPASGRGRFLLYIEYFWTLGSIYVNGCAWATLEPVGWRVFTALAAIPTLISSVAGYFLMPESPRWLVTMGREAEALVTINQWATKNKRVSRVESIVEEQPEGHMSLRDMFTKKKKLRTSFLLMGVVWFAFGMAYYGVVMLLPRIFESKRDDGSCSVTFDFKDLAIASAAEVLGVMIAIALIDKPGRTWTQGIFYTLGAISAFILGFRAIGKNVLTFVASTGRLAEMGASCATWVQTPELFPTEVRAEVHGLLNLVSRIGATLAPFLISDQFTQVQCGSIMAGISFMAAVAAMCLPETSGVDLGALEDKLGDSSTDDGSDSFESDDDSSSKPRPVFPWCPI